jgi:hypothetical protein
MCIIGCFPKLKSRDLTRSIADEIIDLDNIPSDKVYKIHQVKIPFKNIKDLVGENSEEDLKKYIRQLIKKINFVKKDYLYQAGIIYAKGTYVKKSEFGKILRIINSGVYFGRKDDFKISDISSSLRPCKINLVKEGEKNSLDIRLLFVFSHERHIKSYLYSRRDWIQILTPKMSAKYLKHNKELENENWDQGVNVHFIKDSRVINEELIKKLKEEIKWAHPIAFVCKSEKIFNKLTEILRKLEISRRVVSGYKWL